MNETDIEIETHEICILNNSVDFLRQINLFWFFNRAVEFAETVASQTVKPRVNEIISYLNNKRSLRLERLRTTKRRWSLYDKDPNFMFVLRWVFQTSKVQF